MLRDARGATDPLGFLMHLPSSYTLNTANLQWGNIATIMLLPQRSLELGLPLVLIVTTLWWRALVGDGPRSPHSGRDCSSPERLMILAGLVAGLLPLAHTYSFGVVLLAAMGLLALFPVRRPWLSFFTAVAAVAVPQMIWITRGSPLHAAGFFEWSPGWSKGPEPLLWFWFKNTGAFIPLLLVALAAPRRWITPAQRRFYLPFALLFIIPNLFRVAPRIWDNNKVLIYWYVASVPLVAMSLERMYLRRTAWRACTTLLCLSLIMGGLLDAWRVASGAVTITVFDARAVEFADMVRTRTAPEAVLVRAPTVDHPILLTGRRSLLGYTSRIRLQGLDVGERDVDLKCIYTGCPDARALLAAYGVDYIVVGPQERVMASVNEDFLRRFQVAAESGDYQLRRVGQ
jgi:hypothetical protein